jgi:DNA recombination protein RmuC
MEPLLVLALLLSVVVVAIVAGVTVALVLRRATLTGLGMGGTSDELRHHLEAATQASVNQALVTASQSLADQTEDRLRSQHQMTTEQTRAAQDAIEKLVAPLQTKLHQLDSHVRALESSRAGAYAKLDQQVTDTRSLLSTLQTETNHLNAALRRSDTRGRWGELQLERVIELAGMTEHVSYARQVQQTGSGTGRPDVTVHLTDGHVLYIDAKAPMDAFHDAVAGSDPEHQREHLARHAKAMTAHVVELERRGYTRDERSLPFMVLFVPTEASLAAAAEADPRLIESALERGIAIASPTSLAMMLTNISLGWRQQVFAANAREILTEVQELHGRLVTFSDHLRRAGSSLESAVKHYNQAVGSFEARLRPAARTIESLGATDQVLPDLDEITLYPRELREVDPALERGS